MNRVDTKSRYGIVGWSLHWIIAVGILAQWLLAEADEDPGPSSSFDAMSLHQSIGLTILLLAVFRLGWRLKNGRPEWPADIKPYEVTLARIVHVAFYVLLFAVPLTGWMLSSVENEPLRFFNWFDVPRMVLAGKETLEDVHETIFNVLAALAGLHIIGAAKHWFTARLRRKDAATA
jgi:cytochrome b561